MSTRLGLLGWARISAALVRLTHYGLGAEWLVEMLLYADLEGRQAGRGGKEQCS